MTNYLDFWKQMKLNIAILNRSQNIYEDMRNVGFQYGILPQPPGGLLYTNPK